MKFALTIAVALAAAATNTLAAQTVIRPEGPVAPYSVIAAADRPDAPNASTSAPAAPAPDASGLPSPAITRIAPYHPPQVAPLYHKYIEPGQTAQPLASADKVLFGFHQLESPYLLLTIAGAAGYEQAVNGSPNYGTDIGAYGQRLGAAAIRDASQDIFSDSIMASVLHEDPRYYVMGSRRKPGVRLFYAISRIFVTRTDDGTGTPNYSLISGYAGAAALENAYYPRDNRGAIETARSFATSLGGAALSNVVREFLPDLLRTAHLER